MMKRRELRTRPAARVVSLLLIGVMCGVTRPSQAHGLTGEPPLDEIKARMLGSLLQTRVDVELHDQTADQALSMLGNAIGWSIVDFCWSDAALARHGGAAPKVNIAARDISAYLALEIILAQSCSDEPVAWQLGPGIVEVGSKSFLATRGSSETRVYDSTGLLASKSYFQSPQMTSDGRLIPRPPPDVEGFNHPYRPAAPYDGAMIAQYRSSRSAIGEIRQSSDVAARSIMRGFVDLVEPDNWNLGDRLDLVLPGELRYQPQRLREMEHCIAQIRRMQNTALLVTAPDFMQRQLGGYGKQPK